MDPLSVIASIAGVAQAGASLSSAIFNMIDAARSAPREITNIGRGISDLSIVMGELRRVLKGGKGLFRRKLLRQIASSMRRIDEIHNEIEELLDIKSGFGRIKWVVRRSKSTQLLHKIESHKNGMTLVLQTMVLARQIKQVSRSPKGAERVKDGHKAEAKLTCQQAENLIQISYHSFRDLVSEDDTAQNYADDNEGHDDEDSKGFRYAPSRLWRTEKDETARWLYDLVFSAAVEARALEMSHDIENNESQAAHAKVNQSGTSMSNEVIPLGGDEFNPLQLITQELIPIPTVLDELLSQWTTLTEKEIMWPFDQGSKVLNPGSPGIQPGSIPRGSKHRGPTPRGEPSSSPPKPKIASEAKAAPVKGNTGSSKRTPNSDGKRNELSVKYGQRGLFFVTNDIYGRPLMVNQLFSKEHSM